MIDDTLLEAEEKMDKAVSVAKEEFSIIRTGRAQYRIADRMEQHIPIRVAGQALGMFQREPANAQLHARLECVRVVAKSDACVHVFCACFS